MSKCFKVVKIISDKKIVVNAGSNDSIKANDKLEIFIKGEEVLDPDTDESLGTLDSIKAYVSVIDIFPRMCICTNAEVKTYNALMGFQGFIKTEILPLNVDPTEISGGLNNIDKTIKVGDLVRQSAG